MITPVLVPCFYSARNQAPVVLSGHSIHINRSIFDWQAITATMTAKAVNHALILKILALVPGNPVTLKCRHNRRLGYTKLCRHGFLFLCRASRSVKNSTGVWFCIFAIASIKLPFLMIAPLDGCPM